MNTTPHPIHWDSARTHVLSNPKMPEAEVLEAEAILLQQFPLPGHVWVATSGSTAEFSGQLKWVALSKTAFLSSADGVNRHLRSDAKDIWALALPEFHVGGQGIRARAYLSGAEVLETGPWNPQKFYTLCLEKKATLSALVPAQIFDLVHAGLHSPPLLRAIVVGGGALNESLAENARLLGWKILPSYGCTETCSQVATADPFQLDDLRMKILPHVEIATDEDGRLKFRGASLLTGYVILSSQTKPRWIDPKQNGWFISEDLGSCQYSGRQGYVEVQGRRADFVKVGGESVDLTKLERILMDLKSRTALMTDLAVVAVPDPRLGHVIHAASAGPNDPESSRKLQIFWNEFNSAVLPFEKVRKVHQLAKIPRSPLGKLLRGELLGMLEI